jgi:Tfp pilus assembly protein PilN
MTVLSTEMQVVGTTRAVLPRVNLLPPEIAEKQALRRLQVAMGAVGVGALAVVGLLYMSASHAVSSADTELAAAKSQTTALQTQVAKYNDVTAIYNAADAAQAQLVLAMNDEVRYSQMLNDISLTVPSNVWITNLVFSQALPAKTTTATTTTAAPVGPAPIGTVTVNGTGFSHDDVAAWLDALAGLKTYSNPYFSNSAEVLVGTRKTVNFTSTANVTDKALSGRYLRQMGK